MAVVVFNLVLLVSQINDPDIRELIEIIDREIRTATIDAFPMQRSDGIYANLRRANFASKIRLVLPTALDVQNKGDGEWYCVFEPEGLKARLIVTTDDHFLTDDDDEIVEIMSEMFEALVRQLVGETYDTNRNIYFPDGILYYEVFDTDAVEDEAPPLEAVAWMWRAKRNHYWRYFRREVRRIRQAQFRLMVPLDAGKDVEDIIEFIGQEIRRADFPDDSKERE